MTANCVLISVLVSSAACSQAPEPENLVSSEGERMADRVPALARIVRQLTKEDRGHALNYGAFVIDGGDLPGVPTGK